jgi:hypothetical protein
MRTCQQGKIPETPTTSQWKLFGKELTAPLEPKPGQYTNTTSDEFYTEKMTRLHNCHPLPRSYYPTGAKHTQSLLSGTPYEKGPADMEHWINLLKSEDWKEHGMPRYTMPDEFKKLSKSVTRLTSQQIDDVL